MILSNRHIISATPAAIVVVCIAVPPRSTEDCQLVFFDPIIQRLTAEQRTEIATKTSKAAAEARRKKAKKQKKLFSGFCREYLLVPACIRVGLLCPLVLFLAQIQSRTTHYRLSPDGKEPDVREGCRDTVKKCGWFTIAAWPAN
jgi:hypothetical protein